MRMTLLLAPFMMGVSSLALAASPDMTDLRVGKLEKEMKAVQRKVFPNGSPVEPDITASSTSVAPGAAASAPLLDVTQRVDLLEAQIKTLTGQIEQNNVRLKRLEDGSKAYDTRLKAMETPPSVVPVSSEPSSTSVKSAVTAPSSAKSVKGAKGTPIAKAKDVPAKPVKDVKREALVAAVAIPDTGDAAEDSYTYGYRLFLAKLYPESQVKLTEFTAKYPKSKRFTFAQNLLGRSYYEEGKYGSAARAFVDNYQKMPNGERAPESLSWAGLALIKDGAPAKACKVYDAFDGVYGTKASKDVLARVAKGRVDAKCAG